MRQVELKRKDGGVDVVTAYEWQEVDLGMLDRKAVKTARRGKNGHAYLIEFGTFDIESTTIDCDTPYGFMYHWQMCIGGIDVYGRTWSEFGQMIDKLVKELNISPAKRFVFYIHNMSFEHQFMREFIKKYCGDYKIFAPQKRKPLKIECANGLELRCSYKLSNMSLDRATNTELGVIHVKASGDLDYKKLRTPETPLDDAEFGYTISDTHSLWEYVGAKLRNNHDNLESIPMTSTGYVRRACRRACLSNPNYRNNIFLKQRMTESVYTMLKEAGRGGNTHASRYLAGRIYHNADSYDVVSSYPAQMLLHKYPMTKFMPYGSVDNLEEFGKLLAAYACLFRITMTDVRVKAKVSMPYIPLAKISRRSGDVKMDNGRLLSANMISTTLTDIDWTIIQSQYTYDNIYITDMHIAEYGDLPAELSGVVKLYIQQKTELKTQIEELKCSDPDNRERLEELLYLYGKKKNELNGIFGMAYTDPVHDEIIESGCEWEEIPASIPDALERFYKSRNSFLSYAWGVWITAHARAWLQLPLDIIDGDDRAQAIYCDTDSVKGIDIPEKLIQELNERIKKQCEERGAYVDVNGKREYVGIFEKENNIPIRKFITLGAKKYAYEDEDGLHITVSGVNKKLGSKEMPSIEDFRVGYIFEKAGGNTLYYNDAPEGVHTITVDGCEIETASNIGMINSTYTLGVTDEYWKLINNFQNFL